MKQSIKILALILATTVLTTSCTLAKVSKLARQIEVLQVGNISIKGSSGIALDVEVRNQSNMSVTMSDAVITIKMDGEEVATINQVGEVTSTKGRLEIVSTLWKLQNANPMMMLLLTSRLTQQSTDNITADFSAELSAAEEGFTHTLTGKDVDISKFLGDFKF